MESRKGIQPLATEKEVGGDVKIKVWYACDPAKNKACKKTTCMHNVYSGMRCCDRTSHIQYSVLDGNGKPIIAMERPMQQASPDVPEPP